MAENILTLVKNNMPVWHLGESVPFGYVIPDEVSHSIDLSYVTRAALRGGNLVSARALLELYRRLNEDGVVLCYRYLKTGGRAHE